MFSSILNGIGDFFSWIGSLFDGMGILTDIGEFFTSFWEDIGFLVGIMPGWLSALIGLIVSFMIVCMVIKAIGWILDAIPIL